MPERVLEQLHQLGLGRGAHRHDLLDQRAVERLDRPERRLVDAGHDLRRVLERPRRVAGVDPLGRVAEEEVLAGPEPRLPRAAGAGTPRSCPGTSSTRARRARPGASTRAERRGRGLDVGEVGRAVAQRGGHRDHRDVEAGELLDLVGDRVAGAAGRGDPLARHVLDVRAAGAQRRHAGGVELVAGDAEPGLDRAHRDGQPDVALADDDDVGVAVVDPFEHRAHLFRSAARGRSGLRTSCPLRLPLIGLALLRTAVDEEDFVDQRGLGGGVEAGVREDQPAPLLFGQPRVGVDVELAVALPGVRPALDRPALVGERGSARPRPRAAARPTPARRSG